MKKVKGDKSGSKCLLKGSIERKLREIKTKCLLKRQEENQETSSVRGAGDCIVKEELVRVSAELSTEEFPSDIDAEAHW